MPPSPVVRSLESLVQRIPHPLRLQLSSTQIFLLATKKGSFLLVESPRARNLRIVHPNLFCNLWHHSHHPGNLILGDGSLHLVMFTEVSPHDSDHEPHLNWEVHWAKKNLRDWLEHLVIISGKNSTEYVRLLSWTEEIILRNTLLSKWIWNKEIDWFRADRGVSRQ